MSEATGVEALTEAVMSRSADADDERKCALCGAPRESEFGLMCRQCQHEQMVEAVGHATADFMDTARSVVESMHEELGHGPGPFWSCTDERCRRLVWAAQKVRKAATP